MKRALIAAVALFILLVAGQAMALSQDEAQSIVAATGCTADVYTRTIPVDGFNAYYSPFQHVIILLNFDALPLAWQKFILLHEVGHCLQYQHGEWGDIRARGPHEIEWDADAFAIRKMEELGYDGQAINEELLAFVWREWHMAGDDDDSHGTLVDRVTRGKLNRGVTRLESYI